MKEATAMRDDYRAGEIVAAKWSNGLYYIATVVGKGASGFVVMYGDGDEGVVKAEDMAPVPREMVIEVGEKVLACWKGAEMYPGEVVEKRAGGYVVAWADGDPPLVVPVGRITYLKYARLEPRRAAGEEVRVPPVVSGSGGVEARVELAIFLPGEIMPEERGIKFVEPLMDVLEAEGVGKVVEEGTSVGEVNGRKVVTGAHVFVAVTTGYDIGRAVELVRGSLRKSGAPRGSVITDGSGGRWEV